MQTILTKDYLLLGKSCLQPQECGKNYSYDFSLIAMAYAHYGKNLLALGYSKVAEKAITKAMEAAQARGELAAATRAANKALKEVA